MARWGMTADLHVDTILSSCRLGRLERTRIRFRNHAGDCLHAGAKNVRSSFLMQMSTM